MARTYDPNRRCLPVVEWPEADQILWQKAIGPVRLLDPNCSRAAEWSSATQHKFRRGYGRWLGFCIQAGIDTSLTPRHRVTPATMEQYIDHLESQDCASQTIAQRIAELMCVMLALIPGHDWEWLKRLANFVRAEADENHETQAPTRLAPEVALKAIKALRKIPLRNGSHPMSGAVAYRNWLMVLLLCLAPMRLKNFTALRVGQELRQRGTSWCISVPGVDAKMGIPYMALLPSEIIPFIKRYLDSVRPALLRGNISERLWISYRGTPISEHGLSLQMTKFTRRELNDHINPHKFRRMVATSISVLKPEEIDTARAMLGHATRKTTHEHYIAAEAILASQRHAQLIHRLRRTLPGTKRPRNVSKSTLQRGSK